MLKLVFDKNNVDRFVIGSNTKRDNASAVPLRTFFKKS